MNTTFSQIGKVSIYLVRSIPMGASIYCAHVSTVHATRAEFESVHRDLSDSTHAGRKLCGVPFVAIMDE